MDVVRAEEVPGASGRTGLVVAVLTSKQNPLVPAKWGGFDTGQLFCPFRSRVGDVFLPTMGLKF